MLGVGINVRRARTAKAIAKATMLLTSNGDGTGVATLRMRVSQTMTVTLDGSARFYSNLAGTEGESTSWTITSGAMRTIYLRAPSGTSTLNIPNRHSLICIGDNSNTGWEGAGTNMPRLFFIPSQFPNLFSIRIIGRATLTGNLPLSVTYLHGDWSFLWNNVTSIHPLNYIHLVSNSSISIGSNIFTQTTYILLYGDGLNFETLDWSGTGNLVAFQLNNFRTNKLTDTEMITILNSIRDRVGAMPSNVYIGDYANWNNPPQAVLDARAAAMAAKNITTLTLAA